MTHQGDSAHPPTYNLIDETWIRVIDTAGEMTSVSLRTAVVDASCYAKIVGEVPTQAFAILRLIQAILQRALSTALRTHGLEAWKSFNDDWTLVAASVSSYLDRFHNRFDLLSTTQPFFQVADLRSDKNEVSGLAKLLADVPNGNPYLTTRSGKGVEQVSYAEAARWLVHVHAFDISGIKTGAARDPRNKNGRGYPEGPGWAGQLGGIYAVGTTLSETLLLNLLVPQELGITTSKNDTPVWERPPQDQCVDDTNHGEPRGLIDLYTWQARRVRLIWDSEGVTGVVLSYGDKMTPQNRFNLEPMTAWRFSEPQTKKFGQNTYMPQEHSPERDFWRGLSGILPHAEQRIGKSGQPMTRPPAVTVWLALLRENDLLSTKLTILHAVGVEYGPQQSTFAEIIDDELVLSIDTLTDPGLTAVVLAAVDITQQAVFVLSSFAHNVSIAGGGDPQNEGPRNRAREEAYAAIGGDFQAWLTTVQMSRPQDALLAEWHTTLRKHILSKSDQIITRAPHDAWRGRIHNASLLDVGRAEVWFRSGLAKNAPSLLRHTATPTNTLEEELK